MRKYFRIALFALTLSLSGISCQKELSSPESQHDVFNEKAAKEWYYGTFKKSAEWAASNLKGKKLPDWKHPVAGKLGNYDIAEFPLVSGSTSFPIYSNQANRNLVSADLIRIANGSVSKIIFFKGNSGEIFVREIDFIPDWDYLKEKKYDISDISILNKEKEFSGIIIVKKWDGSLVSSVMYKNGQQIMKSKLIRVGNDGKNGEVNSIETLVCTDYQFCVWQQDCEIVINGDQMTTICEEWYNTGDCWIETYCEDDGEDCVLTGTCGDPDPPAECGSMSCEDAENALSLITTSTPNQIGYSSGPDSSPDIDGVIRKNLDPKWGFFTLNFVGNYKVDYTARFSGIVFRNGSQTQWKWETLAYQSTFRTGLVPPCFSLEMDVSCSTPIISSDKLTATVPVGGLQWDCEVTHPCLLGIRSATYTEGNSLSQEFYAN